MIAINTLNLKKNPFEDLTPNIGEPLIWAGLQTQKEDITNVYKSAFASQAKRLILNWGPIGGGKTHAAYYFGNNIIEGIEKDKCSHIYIRLPLEQDPIRTFVVRIVEYLLTNNLSDSIHNLIVSKDKKSLESEISKYTTESSTISTFLSLFSYNSPEIIKLYINNTITSTQRTKYGIIKPLKTDEDCIAFLTVLLVTLSLEEDKRIFLWIDEMENMIFYPSKKMTIFAQMLREVTDAVSRRMVTFLNFTLSETDEDTVKLLIGSFLWARITKKVRFKDLDRTEAKLYTTDLINSAIIDKNKINSPFSKEIIEKVVENIPFTDLIPREINRRFSAIIDYCLLKDIISIDMEVVNKVLQELDS